MAKTYQITSGEILKLMEDAEMYKDDEFERYKAESEWLGWMGNFTDAAVDEMISEKDGKVIDSILEVIFKFVHSDMIDDTYIDKEIAKIVENDKNDKSIYFV